MKPTKKQTKSNATKSHEIEKTSVPVPGIQTFFKAAPKSFLVDKNKDVVKSNNNPKQFYIDVLKEKLQSKFFTLNFMSKIYFVDALE